MTTYWWMIYTENSDLGGKEFFTTLKTNDELKHRKYAQSIFPKEVLHCIGQVSEEDVEILGYDIY